MKNFIILLFVVAPSMVFSRDILFNRLEKLYAKDSKHCLEVAQRYMGLFPDNASSYYFASIIYDERADKSKTVQGKYRNVKKAIGYALTFEDKDDGTLALEVNWDDFRVELTESAKGIINQLEVANETKFSRDLLSSITKLDENVEVVITTLALDNSSAPAMEEVEAAEVIHVGAGSKLQFFGLPSGRESVESLKLEGEQEVLALINEERIRLGMEPLIWEENLARAARYHAYDLATQDYFDHQSYDIKGGKLVEVGGTFERIRKFYNTSFVNSENIAAGNGGAEDTYQQWFNSKGHYENMFNKDSRKVGLGVFYDENSTFGYYWVFCTAH